MRKRWAYGWKAVAAVAVVLVLGEFAVRALALSHRRSFQITADLGSVQAAGSTVR